VAYLSAAGNLLDGAGLLAVDSDGGLEPMTHLAPLFPAILAAAGAIGVEPAAAARGLNAALLGANAVLVGLLVRRLSGAALPALAGAALFLLSTDAIAAHAYALSEPVFLLLALSALLLAARHLETGRLPPLAAAGAAAGFSFLARYPGAFVAAGAAAGVWLAARARGRAASRPAILLAAVAAVPAGAWMLRNSLAAGTAVHRSLAFHPPGREHLDQTARTISGWVLPLAIPREARLLAAAAVAAAFAALWIRDGRALRRGPAPPAARDVRILLGAFTAAYAGLLVVSITFVDAATPLEPRILLPLFAALLVTATGSLGRAAGSARGGAARKAIPAGAAIVLGLFYLARGAAWVTDARAEGLGYASERWRTSSLVEAVRRLPEVAGVHTNAPEAVHWLTGRIPSGLPARIDRFTLRPDPAYERRMDELRGALAREGGYVVHVEGLRRDHLPPEEELVRRLGLALVERHPDGVILSAARTAPQREAIGHGARRSVRTGKRLRGAQDAVTEIGTDGRLREHVDATSQKRLQVQLHPGQVEEVAARFQVHQQVQIAVGGRPGARPRSEDAHTSGAVGDGDPLDVFDVSLSPSPPRASRRSARRSPLRAATRKPRSPRATTTSRRRSSTTTDAGAPSSTSFRRRYRAGTYVGVLPA
jgi:hypothetical protein